MSFALTCALAATLGTMPLASGCRAADEAPASVRYSATPIVTAERIVEEPADSTPPDSAAIIYNNAAALAMARRGILLDSTLNAVENQYDTTQIDTLVTYRYQNAVARYLHLSSGQRRSFFVSVTLTGPVDGLPFGIGVGSSDSLVLQRFGPPGGDDTTNGVRTLLYLVGEEGIDTIIFRLRGNLVFEVSWVPYLD